VSDIEQTVGTTPASTGNPAPQETAPQRSEPQIPAGKRIVDESEYELLSRHSNNYKGAAPLIDRLTKSGVKGVDDLDRMLGSYKAINEIGLDVDQLRNAFRREEQEEQGNQTPQFDPNEIDSRINQTVNSRLAMIEHQTASQREVELIESAAKKLAGDSASAARIDAARRLILAEARDGSARLYDPSDPVKGTLAQSYFMPHDEKSLAGVVEKVGALWKELSVAEIRDAARRGTPTPGQSVTGGDGPSTEGKQNRPFASMSQEEKLREFQRRFNEKRGGAPMSQA
jgi:hypothetical protein